ncbi:urea ABC transporter permease subunit UrtB [Desulfogranum marinum]|uniref:urea ABC transporter permease subunit UrtB n=1 Tax=Desulfogranum marinum TaxID=453220 RepID=UPI001964C5D2|nr:urea ABC transporter permease subunit UrtB [Desulfogranum marinum]MBM9511002.1 urea ABC transporter permease subunit UrtB [Desulfogranum marinum]
MNTVLQFIITGLLFCLPILSTSVAFGATQSAEFEQGVQLLASKSFTEKEQAIHMIGNSGDPLAIKTLQAVYAGKLFFVKKDKTLVYGEPDGSTYSVTDFISGEDLGLIKKRKLKKITINNKLRGVLKSVLAGLNLQHPDPKQRLAAAEEILTGLNPELITLLKKSLLTEQDPEVREALTSALAVAGLHHQDPQQRLASLALIAGNLNPVVKNAIQALIEKENDPIVLKKAEAALKVIEAKSTWYARLETLFFGLSLGSVLVLAAIGLAITFGVIGVINMAHGELIMLGAYTTYVLQQLMPNYIGLALALSIPAAFCVSGLTGILIEKSVIRFLYGRPLETLLATFGISLVLQQTVRSIFSPLNRSVATPDWMSGSLVINPLLSLTTNRVTIFLFAMIVFAGLFVLLKKSSLGLNVRAVAQNRNMARAMGVKAARVDALTFGLGSGIAGIAGVALSQLTNVGPNLGQAYIIDSFMVVVFGGVGNLWGTLVGGLSLGIANKFLEPWIGAVLAKIIILIFIILFIQKRPQGLFPQKGRAAE